MISKTVRKFGNLFQWGIYAIPAPQKAVKGGQDAYFGSERALAVADGVGGWAYHGVDPSKYAWTLIKNINKECLETKSNSPKIILKNAAKGIKQIGSSTCCLCILDQKHPQLYTANIGDSGFYLIRKEQDGFQIVEESTETVHGFNFPFQLGTNGDSPDSAKLEVLSVKDGDFLMLYTDGVSDNLFPKETTDFLNSNFTDNLSQLSRRLVLKCKENSLNKNYHSPFAYHAKKSRALAWKGGKPDDITVIFSQILLNK